MTDKELRHLSRAELIEIIYQQKKDELELRAKLQTVSEQLRSREIKKENAGSLAEAALSVNGVFEAAQRAADDYLKQIRADHAELEARCTEMLAQTEEKCRQREEETDRQVEKAWALFNKKVLQYVRSHKELLEMISEIQMKKTGED